MNNQDCVSEKDTDGYVSLNELSEVSLDLTAQGLGKLQVRQ